EQVGPALRTGPLPPRPPRRPPRPAHRVQAGRPGRRGRMRGWRPVMNRRAVKSVLRRVGAYPLARHWYRRADPGVRRTRADEARFYRQFVGAGDLCFDVGANLGQTIEPLIDCRANVVAVEPNPLSARVLRWEFGGRTDVTIVEQAVGSEPGSADLHFAGTDATASLRDDWPFAQEGVCRGAVTTLDELIGRFGVPKLLKVDVEGYELEV